MVRIIKLMIVLIVVSISSCTSVDNDPIDDSSSINLLYSSFNGIKLDNSVMEVNNTNNQDLPLLKVSEAISILNDIRNTCNSYSNCSVKQTLDNNGTSIVITMNKNIQDKFNFTIDLNTSIDNNGNLFYEGYSTDTTSNIFTWNINLFSFETDKENTIKFSSESYIIMRIDDNGTKYVKIPMEIKGIFNAKDMTSNFKYMI